MFHLSTNECSITGYIKTNRFDLFYFITVKVSLSLILSPTVNPGGVLPYLHVNYIGLCGPKGYDFWAVLVCNRVLNFPLWVRSGIWQGNSHILVWNRVKGFKDRAHHTPPPRFSWSIPPPSGIPFRHKIIRQSLITNLSQESLQERAFTTPHAATNSN